MTAKYKHAYLRNTCAGLSILDFLKQVCEFGLLACVDGLGATSVFLGKVGSGKSLEYYHNPGLMIHLNWRKLTEK